MLKLEILSHTTPCVAPALVVYAALGLLDLGFTTIALTQGFREANPILAWYQDHGLFEAVKIGATMCAVTIGHILWSLPAIRIVMHLANLLMFGVFAYHLQFWITYISRL